MTACCTDTAGMAHQRLAQADAAAARRGGFWARAQTRSRSSRRARAFHCLRPEHHELLRAASNQLWQRISPRCPKHGRCHANTNQAETSQGRRQGCHVFHALDVRGSDAAEAKLQRLPYRCVARLGIGGNRLPGGHCEQRMVLVEQGPLRSEGGFKISCAALWK